MYMKISKMITLKRMRRGVTRLELIYNMDFRSDKHSRENEKNGLDVLREVDTDEIVEKIGEVRVVENRGRVRPRRNGWKLVG